MSAHAGQTPAEIEEITHNDTHIPQRSCGIEVGFGADSQLHGCMVNLTWLYASEGKKWLAGDRHKTNLNYIKRWYNTIINDMFSVNCQLPFPRIYRESVKQTLFGVSSVDAAGTPYGPMTHNKAGPRGKGKLMVVTL